MYEYVKFYFINHFQFIHGNIKRLVYLCHYTF